MLPRQREIHQLSPPQHRTCFSAEKEGQDAELNEPSLFVQVITKLNDFQDENKTQGSLRGTHMLMQSSMAVVFAVTHGPAQKS